MRDGIECLFAFFHKAFRTWALSFPSASPSRPRGASLNFVSFACSAYLPLTLKS